MADKYKKINDLKALGPAPRMPKIDPINPPAPTGTYRSAINTSAPLSQAFAQSLTAKKLPSSSNYGNSATGISRSAFANALLADTNRQTSQEIDRFNVAQRTQAEKSRAEDILSQRQSLSDRYRMDVMRDIFEADTDQRYRSGMKDLKEQYAREKKEAQAAFWSSFL
jgi:hypothetical protein